ncbi:hypothetical protein OQA88_7877 [Cercophora sp. LCS_1]
MSFVSGIASLYEQATTTIIVRTLCVIGLVGFLAAWRKLHQVRTMVRELPTKHGIPIIPHSYLFGHLITAGKAMMRYPDDIFGGVMAQVLLEAYPEIEQVGVIYLDMWPIIPPIMYIFHPTLMAQYTSTAQPKSTLLKNEFYPVTRNLDLVTSDGPAWKAWRARLNPGFSARNVVSMVPDLLEEVQIFIEKLKKTATSGNIIKLEEFTLPLTIDVVSRAAIGLRLQSQTVKHPIHRALDSQISWLVITCAPHEIPTILNPFRHLFVWLNNRVFRTHFEPLIRQIAADQLAGKVSSSQTKTIISLAVKDYLANITDEKEKPEINEEFIDVLMQHLFIFLFAGHDTTAVTLCFAYHLLHTNPQALSTLRAELDSVLGPTTTAASSILTNPSLLNSLPYTQAVVKETLRLFPPAGGVRQGSASLELTHPDTGLKLPTDNWILFAVSFASQRWDKVWEEPTKFKPERWLTEVADEKLRELRRHAFRPFETGPRGCIGQELAMMEMKMVLALTVREFDVESVFEGDREVWGDKAWQVGFVTGHARDGMPVRVRRR